MSSDKKKRIAFSVSKMKAFSEAFKNRGAARKRTKSKRIKQPKPRTIYKSK